MVEQHDLVSILCNEVQIVRDQNDRHVLLGAKLGNDIVKKLQTVLVDARDRLIEEQQVGHGIERERQKHALQFAARQCAEPPVDEVLGMDAREALQDARPQRLRGKEPDGAAREARHEDVHDARRRTDVEAQVLRHIADDGLPRAPSRRVRIGEPPLVRHFAEDGTKERRFSRAVRPDERRELAAVDVEVHAREDFHAPEGYGEVFDLRAAEMTAVVRGTRTVMQDILEQGDAPF